MSLPVPPLEVISRTRLHPSPRDYTILRTVPLSIVDNTVVNYSLTSAAWYFDPPTSPACITPDALAQSLRTTIDSYPQWAGQLHWIPYDPAKGHRQGRTAITYGTPNDPGVELVLTRYPKTLASLLPSHEARMQKSSSGPLAWDANSFPSDALNCPTQLALHDAGDHAGRPAVAVQLTTFACGGLGIRVKIVHCLADATALMHFVKDWGAVHRAILRGEPIPTLQPVFDPALVDRAAAGDIHSATPDPDILRVARSLPMCRYDWWASAEGCPEPMLPSTRIPPELAGTHLGPPGDPIPWSEWNIYAPVSHYLLYFTPGEVQRIWEASVSTDDPAYDSPQVRISRLDALLAFIWRLIVRARGLEHDRELMHIMVTIGLRSRLSPPLPDTFLGSPITLARVSLPAAEIASTSQSKTGLPPTPATAIRSAMAQFTPAALTALLHEMAHDVNPQHIWRACLGRRNSIVTSWQGLDVYGLDLGGGAPPRYVDAVMPNMDGCIHVMEAGPPTSGEGGGNGARWYAEPVCLSLHLAKDVMDRLLKDPELRRYRDATS